jgi:hypothetical protein
MGRNSRGYRTNVPHAVEGSFAPRLLSIGHRLLRKCLHLA